MTGLCEEPRCIQELEGVEALQGFEALGVGVGAHKIREVTA